jgi:hypothetical protein
LRNISGSKSAVKKSLRFDSRAVALIDLTKSQRKKKPLNLSGLSNIAYVAPDLLDDLYDAASMGINQNGSIVDDRVAIPASTVFLGHVVVGHARFGKLGTHPYLALIAVGRAVLFNHIPMKAGSLIYAQYSCYTADDPSDRAANDSSHRPGSPLAFARTTFDAFRYTLSRCRNWDDNRCRQKCRCENLAKHLEPPV